jgi:hypothetical protein
VRLAGDGTGALINPRPFNVGVPDSTDPSEDMLAPMRRPDGNPAPLLVLQHVMGISRQLCISYGVDPGQLVCNATPAAGPLVVGDLNGSFPGVPPEEVIASRGRGHDGHLRLPLGPAAVAGRDSAHGTRRLRVGRPGRQGEGRPHRHGQALRVREARGAASAPPLT